MSLEDARITFLASVGPVTVAELAVQMLRQAKVDYRFDVEQSDRRVLNQAGGLAWHGALLKNLEALAESKGLKVVIEGTEVRFVGA